MLLGLIAADEIRYERILALAYESKDGPICRVDFDKLSMNRSELDLPDLLKQSDHIICNEGTPEYLQQAIDAVIAHEVC
jgi:hypothetical protein